MDSFDEIKIESGSKIPNPITSVEDEPPAKESASRTDNIKSQGVEDAKSYRRLREVFAEKAYKVAKKSLYGWAVLLFFQGWFSLIDIQIFSDKVLIAITTAVTLNVFAAFLGVIRGLFPSGGKNSIENEK